MGTFRQIKKYTKPSLDLDEKIEYLNTQLIKTGMLLERPTNSTVGLYSNDTEDTTQNTNIREPGTGTNDIGEPFQGVFGNYDQNASFSYIIVSGAISSRNTGQYVVFDHIRDENNKVLYSIPRLFTLSGDRLHFKSVYISSRLITGLRKWTVNGVTTAGATYELYVGTTGFATGKFRAGLVNEGPTLVKFWSNSVEQPIPGEIRQKPSWYHFMRRGGYGGKDPWEELKKRLKAGKDFEDEQDRRRRARRGRNRKRFGFDGPAGPDLDPLEVLAKLFLKVANSLPFIKLYSKARIQLMDYAKWLRNQNDRPNPTPIDREQKRWWVSKVDERLKLFYNKDGIGIGVNDDPGLTKNNIAMAFNDVLINERTLGMPSDIYMVHGQLRTGWNPKGSTSYGFSLDGRGGINIIDGYDFVGRGNINAGAPGLAGGLLPLIANAATEEEREILDKELNKLPTMKQVTQISASDIRGSLLEKVLSKQNINEDYKSIKRVSSAIKDPSPILETKTIQTEQKSPARFFKKEKPKTKEEIFNCKIEELNKELEKTGMLLERPTNSTVGLYNEPGTPIPQPDSWQTIDEPSSPPASGASNYVFANNNQFLYTDDDGNTYKRLDTKGVGDNNPSAYAVAFALSFDVTLVGYIGADGFKSTGSSGIVNPEGEWSQYQSIWTNNRDSMPVVGWVYRTSGFRPAAWFKIYAYTGETNTTDKVPVNKRLDDPDYLPVLSRTGDNIRGTDPNQVLQDMLKSGLEYMDKKFRQFSPFDMIFKKFETMASVVGLDGAANTLREYGNFLSGRSSYTPEKPKMTNASTEEKKAILKQAEDILFGEDARLTPTIEGLKNKYYKPPVTEKEKQRARRIIGQALSRSINGPTTKDLYYQHGSVSPTFHKGRSNAEGISSDGSGGLNVNDGYDFAPKEGQTGTENARVPGPAGDVMELMANAMTAEARLPGSKYAGKSIVDLPRMPIRTHFTSEDLKGTALGLLLKDLEKPTKVQKELNSWDKAIKYLKGA